MGQAQVSQRCRREYGSRWPAPLAPKSAEGEGGDERTLDELRKACDKAKLNNDVALMLVLSWEYRR
jgi:hypothetical protein